MEPSKLSVVGKKLFDVIEFDSDEKLYYEIRKHPFGLFIIYLTGFIVAGLLFIIFVPGSLLLNGDPLELGTGVDGFQPTIVLIGVVLTFLALAATAIGAFLYQSNVVLVTSEKIAQVLYRSIFNRKISQLSIGDVQDVTVNQKGLFARLFNYGTLVVETAGEQQNYTFTFTPRPYESSKAIVNAHEENLKLHGN